WRFFRFHGWEVEEDGVLRYPRATTLEKRGDFTAADYLAKDWTTATWDGGSYPPCCTPGPAVAPFPESATGGRGTFTTDLLRCGGDGGDGVRPIVITPETEVDDTDED